MTEPGGDDPDVDDDAVFEQLDESDTLDDPRSGPADPLDEGVSPNEQPWGLDAWGTTGAEEETGQPLAGRLRREWDSRDDRDTGRWGDDGDGIGDSSDTDGEPGDDQVGGRRAGRLAATDDGDDDLAEDVGVDGAGASAEEAAVHVVGDDR